MVICFFISSLFSDISKFFPVYQTASVADPSGIDSGFAVLFRSQGRTSVEIRPVILMLW
jgi:hypothetical protein